MNKYNNKYRQENERIKRQLIEYKGGSCEKCGIIDDPIIYDFHHKNPKDKKFELSNGIRYRKYSLNELKKEVDKCLLVCSHCHRKIHYYNINTGD